MNKAAKVEGECVLGDQQIVLRLLDAVDRDPTVTQRRIADDFGIALGLVNAYLKRCVKKGLIKIGEVPARRYAYYLTPQGFTEKARLARTYLAHSFTFFRNARAECSEILSGCLARGWTSLALVGVGDLAEVMVLCAAESGVQLRGVFDSDAPPGTTLVGIPVVSDFAWLASLDAVVITALENPQAAYDEMVRHLPSERVLAPRLLCLSPSAGRLETIAGAP